MGNKVHMDGPYVAHDAIERIVQAVKSYDWTSPATSQLLHDLGEMESRLKRYFEYLDDGGLSNDGK